MRTIALEIDKIITEWLSDAGNASLISSYTFIVVDPLNKKVLCGCNNLHDVKYQSEFVPE